jgi:hypothetical protein
MFSVGAQTNPNPPLGLDELPDSRPLRLPQSSTNKATIGTVSGDGDYFMSVLDWGSIKNMDSNFFLAGVDEYGLSVGYGQKAGKLYLGASYSGSLIDELFRRMTNQDVLTLRKEDTITGGSSGAYVSSLLDQDNKTPPGETISNNDINLILGSGAFGLRFGFAEWIRAMETSIDSPYWLKEKTFESSLKPSLELGFNFLTGPVQVKTALRTAFDIHEYSSNTGGIVTTNWVVQERLINFYEPSVGFTLGFDFANSEKASAELILDADLAFRLYRASDDPDYARSLWYSGATSGGFPEFPIDPAASLAPTPVRNYKVTIPTDLRITGAPRFAYSGDVSQRLTLGVKLEMGIGFDTLTIEQTDSVNPSEHSSSITDFSIAPDFSIGASFHLIPDHFSLHAGLGLMLFSFRKVTTESEVNGSSDPEVTQKTMSLPSARFAAGLTLNLTEAVAIDLMAVTSGISIDATKFTLLLTAKK